MRSPTKNDELFLSLVGMHVPFFRSIVFLILAALLRNIPRADVYLNSNYNFHCFICLAIVPNNQNPFNKLLEI